jgi:hypothetical protein
MIWVIFDEATIEKKTRAQQKIIGSVNSMILRKYVLFNYSLQSREFRQFFGTGIPGLKL